MKGRVRCAVLGLGRLGYWHAENLAWRVREAELVTVADLSGGRAEKVSRELGVNNFSSRPEAVLEDPDIEAVVIATPTNTHAELIQLAARHGKHVFVEKPLSHDLESADQTIRAVRDSGVYCQVGFMRRFDAAYREAYRRIQAGDIGTPLYYKGISRDPGSPPPEYIRHSGGIFQDMAIHDYDIARYLLQAEVTSVSANGSVLFHPFMEDCGDVDQSVTYLTFDSGAAADIETSRNAFYGYDIRGEVIGSEGTIQIGSLRYHDVRILTRKGSTHDIVPYFPERFKDAYLGELEHFVHCVLHGEPPLVGPEDAKKAMEISLCAQRSFEWGRKVDMSEFRHGR